MENTDINVDKLKDQEGKMPIHWATESNQTEIVKDLLNYTNQSQPGDFQGLTPIHLAASLGLLDMVKFWTNFNSNNCNKEPKSNFWNTPLHLAVNGGHLDVVKYLYNQNYEDGNYNYKLLLNKEIMSPIHVAAKMGHLDIMKFLFEKIKTPPTGPNRYNSYVSYKYQVKDHWVKKDQRGWTPVHWAAKNGHQDIVEFLLTTVHEKFPFSDAIRKSSLTLAAECGHLDIVKFLYENSNMNDDSANKCTIT